MSSADTLRRRVTQLLVLALPLAMAAGIASSSPASADEVYPRPYSGTVHLEGHGWGHGIGMSQYGALGGARAGNSWQQIVAKYYRGTSLGANGNPTIRVRIASLGSSVQVLAEPGLQVTWNLAQSSTLPAAVGGRTVTRWQIRPAPQAPGTATKFRLYYLPSGSSTWVYYSTASVPTTGAFFNSSSGTVTTLRGSTQVVYRGQLRGVLVGSVGAESLVPVVALPMEDYLRSVVPSEMPASWDSDALAAQAVAARSFAEYHRRYAPLNAAFYDVYDDTRSQVFHGTKVGGTNYEYASSNAAVRATAGVVATYPVSGQTQVAFTQFSSSSGGWTAQGSKPYLVAQADPWDAVSTNPNHTWTTSVSVSSIERAYPSIGSYQRMRITGRSGGGDQGGRVTSMVLEGAKGSYTTTGNGFQATLGLKSNWFAPTDPVSAPSYPRDVTGDRKLDVLAVEAGSGALRVYPTTGAGAWRAPVIQEAGTWNHYTRAFTAGTWDGDAISDVMVQDDSGQMYLRRGLGNGTFDTPELIGRGWQAHNLVFPVGDFDGDGTTDLMARRGSDGGLFLYSGTGLGGGFTRARQVGAGWQIFDEVLSPGDFDGDGNIDVLARTPSGYLYLYPGNGSGGWKARRAIGLGWQAFTSLTGLGDFTGDGHADVLARAATGTLYVYPGDGHGGWLPRRSVGSGWQIFSAILK